MLPKQKRQGYRVGFRKPPTKHRFKKGVSGNPKGRPKTLPNIAALLEKDLKRIVNVVENGKPKKITKLEIMIRRLVQQAIEGNPKAMQLVLELAPETTLREQKIQVITAHLPVLPALRRTPGEPVEMEETRVWDDENGHQTRSRRYEISEAEYDRLYGPYSNQLRE